MLTKKQKFYLFWKRCIDLFGSILGITLLSPVHLNLCDYNQVHISKGPVFFKQETFRPPRTALLTILKIPFDEISMLPRSLRWQITA
jgi:hypothetical protein